MENPVDQSSGGGAGGGGGGGGADKDGEQSLCRSSPIKYFLQVSGPLFLYSSTLYYLVEFVVLCYFYFAWVFDFFFFFFN